MSKIRFSYPFSLLTAIFIFFDSESRLFLTVCAMLIHEMGHVFGMISKKIPFEKITVGITGANIIYGRKRLTSYKEDIFIALAGSFFNFIAVGITLASEQLFNADFSFFIGINTLLGLFNYFPVLPLDGGRAVLSFLSMKTDPTDAEIVMRKTGIAAALAGIIAGILLICKKGNYTLLLVSVVIFINNKMEI